MSNERLNRWKQSKRLLTALFGTNKEVMRALIEAQKKNRENDESAPRLTNLGMIEACKELIYDEKNNVPVFHAVAYSFDVNKGEIRIGHMFDILVDENQSAEEIEEDIINTLALAAASDVPVYPNTRDLVPVLARLHRKMLLEGFTAPDGAGKKIRLKLVKSSGKAIEDLTYLKDIDLTETHSPADLALIREVVSRELERLEGAGRVLYSLTYAITRLQKSLDMEKRNESELQRSLTENPILFGTDYIKIIPKHKLGSEYEMDYALERDSGLVDLVEIEASSLPLFNKSGDPSRYLVHAEQQVLDWLHWIEKHGSYARANLPGVMSPIGFVIIGRRKDLSEGNNERLRRRNLLFRGQIQILTYDDLLDRARNLLRHLESLGAQEGNT